MKKDINKKRGGNFAVREKRFNFVTKYHTEMKKFVLLLVCAVLSAFSGGVKAQEVLLNASNHNKTKNICNGYLYDDSKTGNYAPNQDRWVTICPSASMGSVGRVSLYFEEFDIDPSDQFIVYNGPDINSPVMYTMNNVPYFTGQELLGQTIMPSLTSGSGCLTIRLTTDASQEASGFKAKIECASLCQYPEAALDDYFIKIDENNNVTTRPVRDGADTLINEDGSLQIIRYKSIDICVGDSIVLVAKPNFPENDQGYHQDAAGCIYQWAYGDGEQDSIAFDARAGHKWQELSGYDLTLVVTDTANGGCKSRNTIDTRVRIAKNPIKTVHELPDICSGTEMGFSVGYGANSQVVVDSLEFHRGAKERYENTVFIPDGSGCGDESAGGCYESPVTFDNFTPGATVGGQDDIVSVCINIEHSFLYDLSMQLICPNGQSVMLKHRCSGSETFLGVPNETDNSSTQIGPNGIPYKCDSTFNPAGTGWTYCFSNNRLDDQRGVIGRHAGVPMIGTALDSTYVADTSGYFQTPVQTPAGTTATDMEIVDLNGFQSLIGCPLNGEWKIRICDTWGSDNGYIFWWDLELGQNSGANWDYQVPLDTVIWSGPTFFTQTSSTTSVIAPPIDSVGSFIFDVKIIDDFGCEWFTQTPLTVVQTPVVDLGEDIALCEMTSVRLDAGNETPTATYVWSPTGETTREIIAEAPANSNSELTYTVLVTEYNGSIYCMGQDEIKLIVHPAATAAFSSDTYPLEGCEPFSFQLNNTATNAQKYEWTVGEEHSNEANPSFTFPYGTYDVKLKVTSEHGCMDSVEYPAMINVYKHPIADFGWEPTNPYASDPTAQIVNLTKPDDETNQYHWTVQTNRNNTADVTNLFGKEPSYTWTPQAGQNVAGDYIISLDAYSVNQAPSGYIYECHDTISRVITIINDNLMFPTVITPNGDGVNDVFVIHNLVEGQAFPDNELAIYNRYGKRIFFVQDIRNEADFWDPAKTNTPSGTYFYRFIGRGPIRDVEFKGSVEVMR